MAEPPSRIAELVETFDRNIETYKKQPYNEAQVRKEFIDPFFKALGWDVDNQKGYAPAYREVIHEDAIKVAGATEAPDYCFRIGGTRKFFVEAKKPAVDIAAEPGPAYQLRRYAWSAKLPLSVLTDFEEFAVYALGEEKSRDWEHVDLFFHRRTSQEALTGALLDRSEKLTDFGARQIQLSKRLISEVNPKIIVVPNALASRLFAIEFNAYFREPYGHHLARINQRETPVFLGGMLTGQHAMDTFSCQRLKWHVKKAWQYLQSLE